MAPSPSERRQAFEWPTLGLAVMIYAGWILATLFHKLLPVPLLIVAGGWLIAWHGSLQHEIIHDHPTPWRSVNTALAFPPLSLWLPFEIYRHTHTVHHVLENLTDPALDPESRYLTARQGRGAVLGRALGRLQGSLFVRLLLGPVIDAALFVAGETMMLIRGDRERLRIWAVHLTGVAGLLAWLHFICHMPLWVYVLCFVYPGSALSLIRSYAEHRAHPDPLQRTAVVENAPILSLLFLNNNLHPAHHLRPDMPWYELPRFYRRERERLLNANGGLVYAGYAQVFRRYLFKSHDVLMHPAATETAR